MRANMQEPAGMEAVEGISAAVGRLVVVGIPVAEGRLVAEDRSAAVGAQTFSRETPRSCTRASTARSSHCHQIRLFILATTTTETLSLP